jgi:hypothetical protein
MSSLAVLSGMSNILARLAVRPGRGGQPTDRWQDKSRKLRRGRSVGSRRHIRHFARCAPKRNSLRIHATSWKFGITCTSRASTS